MKYLTIPFLCAMLSVCAQTPAATPAPKPAVKPADVPPDTVVLKVGGKPVTAGEFNRIVSTFPAEVQQAAKNNPKQVMQSYFLMRSLSDRAAAEKLDQTSPYKEQLELQRMQFLATTIVNRESGRITVTDDEQQKRYDTEKETKYEQAKIRAIIVSYVDPKAAAAKVNMADPSKPEVSVVREGRTEAEAKTVAEDLVKQLRGGADFAELARQKSEDKATGAKGGDFGVVHRGDRIPEDIKKAVFALKAGEVSDPIKQPLGFYILKVDERKIQPFSEVKQTVANEIKQERFQAWMADLQKQFEVTGENAAFFGSPAPQAQSAPAQPGK